MWPHASGMPQAGCQALSRSDRDIIYHNSYDKGRLRDLGTESNQDKTTSGLSRCKPEPLCEESPGHVTGIARESRGIRMLPHAPRNRRLSLARSAPKAT